MFPIIAHEIPPGQMEAEIRAQETQIERRLNAAVDDVLSFIEQAQILAYTATGNPPLPAGSSYQRTFTLQSASRTERTGERLPDISGRWWVDLGVAPYGEDVLGLRADQAAMFQNRWKSQEDVEREAQRAAPGIVERHLR